MTVIKRNKILSIAILAYIAVGIIHPNALVPAFKGTQYYLIEMIQILPAVFILTSMIQTWVPTSTIIKYFGSGSGVKGTAIAYLIGSLSAGPIYAAFPICKTLLKKGASIKNIIIIISAWAVVKVPMLINEAKFMGFEYMMMRWFLTLVAIYCMAVISEKLIKKEELVINDIVFNSAYCVICGSCLRKAPDTFKEKDGLIYVVGDLAEEHIEICPFGAIQ